VGGGGRGGGAEERGTHRPVGTARGGRMGLDLAPRHLPPLGLGFRRGVGRGGGGGAVTGGGRRRRGRDSRGRGGVGGLFFFSLSLLS
jgi:hypothetical protein